MFFLVTYLVPGELLQSQKQNIFLLPKISSFVKANKSRKSTKLITEKLLVVVVFIFDRN